MHDILFRISGSFAIHSYGLMAMIGFLSAIVVARWRARKVGFSPDAVTDLCIYGLMAGIAGSRIVYVLLPENRSYFFDSSRADWSFWNLFKIWQGGLVFYGGFIGAFIVVLLVLRARKLRILPVLDVLAPSLALGHAFGRIGCYLHGCCYGVPVHAGAWYGCVFPAGTEPYSRDAANPITTGTPLWPTQLVSSFDLFCIFAILTLFFRHRRRAGEVVALYLMLYSVERFIVELFRGDTHSAAYYQQHVFQLSQAQCIGIAIFCAGAILMIALKLKGPEKVAGKA